MATGNEIWFGYTYPEYHEKAPADAPRVPWPLPTDGSEDGHREEWIDQFDEFCKAVDPHLKEAWLAAVKELGWPTPVPKRGKGNEGYFTIHVEGGKRDFTAFSLYRQIGGEMEFDFPDVPIGVPLSSRYFPTFLDWRDPSGTLPNPLVIWTPEMARMIDVATRHIVTAVPWLRAGKVMVLELHY
jgi:hypothetical protein